MDKKIIKYGDEFFLWYLFNNEKFVNKGQEIQNKRQYRFSNFSNLEELLWFTTLIHKLGKKISLVLNNTPANLDNIKKEIEWYEEHIQPDYYIVKDDIMIDEVIKVNPKAKINVSSLRLIFNANDIDFLMKKYPKNINRIVFHRDLWPKDIDLILEETVKKYPELEYELFLANEWCYNADWFCQSVHNPDDNIPFICFRDWMFDNKEITKYTQKKTNCNVCSFLLIKHLDKIQYFKIPWRWMNFDTIHKYASLGWLWLEVIDDYKLDNKEKHKKLKDINKKIFWDKLQGVFCDSCFFKKFCKF